MWSVPIRDSGISHHAGDSLSLVWRQAEKFKARTIAGGVSYDRHRVQLGTRQRQFDGDDVTNLQSALDESTQPALANVEADATRTPHTARREMMQGQRDAV